MLKLWGDREAGKGHELLGELRWAATFWWQGVKQSHVPLGTLSLCWGDPVLFYCKGTVAWPGVLMSALALANGWVPAWHKDVAVSLSLS